MLLFAMALVILGGCGSGSSGSSTNSDPLGASTEFMQKGGNDQPATFGRIANVDEREAASHVLEKNLAARAAGNWAAQCATLTAGKIAQVEEQGKSFGGGHGCAANLRALAEPVSQTKKFRADTLKGPIEVFRVKGQLGYALYHGTGNKDYAMLMKKEGGEWKVARLATTPIP